MNPVATLAHSVLQPADPAPDAPVDALTRRRFLGALAAAGLLAGCGDSDSSPSTRADDGFPRKVDHSGGVTEIPAKPGRIVATAGENDLEALVLVGAPVVAFGTGDRSLLERAPWYRGTPIFDAESFASSDTPDAEKLASYRPDLFVVPDYGYTNRQQVEAVAPVVMLPRVVTEMVRVAGRATGLDDRAEEAVADLERKVAGFEPTWRPRSILQFGVYEPGKVFVYAGTHPASGAYRLAGLPGLSPARTKDAFGVSVGYELLEETLDVDLVIGLDAAAVESEPVFANLPAVREGRYASVGPVLSRAFNSPGPLSLPFMLDELGRILERTSA